MTRAYSDCNFSCLTIYETLPKTFTFKEYEEVKNFSGERKENDK